MNSSRNSHKEYILSQSVVKRRKKRKKIRLIFSTVTGLVLVVFLIWLTSLESIQVKKVIVVGNVYITAGEIQSVTNSLLDQKYIGLFSKRNSFIYPKKQIREILLNTYPRISDVEIYTESFNLLNIKVKERAPSAIWCAPIHCYFVGADSYIYAEILEVDMQESNITSSSSSLSTSSAPTVNFLKINQGLPKLSGGDELVGPEPVGKYVFTPALFNNLLFVYSELQKMKLDVKDAQVFSRDEIVFNLKQGGKIIFADRKPFEQSVDDLKSALGSSVFSSTSQKSQFEYIDTRFGNKVFYRLDKSSKTSSSSSSIKNKI